ncbi:MAG: glycosyltransferase [Thermoanaerobaculia bacterium]
MPPDFKLAVLGPAPPDRGGIAHQTHLLAKALGESLAGYFSYSRAYPRFLNPRRFDTLENAEDSLRATPILDWANPLSWKKAGTAAVESGAGALIAPWWTAFWAMPLRSVFRQTRRLEPSFLNVILCHHVFDHESVVWKKSLAWIGLESADAAIAQSEQDREILESRLRGKPILVLPHPIDDRPHPGREDARRKLGVTGPLVLFLGLIRPYKGVDVLFDAAPRITEETGARIALVGEVFPDSRASINEWMKRPVASRVTLVDRYVGEEEMDLWLAACDVVVCPYRKNSGSGIAARAIAARRPIVASNLSGFLPFVSEASGALVPEDDPAGLADAVIRVVRRGVESYGEALSALARRHSWDGYARAVEDFCRQIGPVSRRDTPTAGF